MTAIVPTTMPTLSPGGPEGAPPLTPGPTVASPRDVRAILRYGRREERGRMVVYVRPAGEETRAAFVAGRSVGGAVARNRARRVMREAWRMIRPSVSAGFDVVFVARPPIGRAKVSDLLFEMQDALHSLGVLAS